MKSAAHHQRSPIFPSGARARARYLFSERRSRSQFYERRSLILCLKGVPVQKSTRWLLNKTEFARILPSVQKSFLRDSFPSVVLKRKDINIFLSILPIAKKSACQNSLLCVRQNVLQIENEDPKLMIYFPYCNFWWVGIPDSEEASLIINQAKNFLAFSQKTSKRDFTK